MQWGGAQATVTATWSWQSNIPDGITSININGDGTLASNVAGINITTTGGQIKSNGQIPNGTIIYIPVVSTKDQIIISGNWKVTYTIGQDASSTTDLSKTYDVQPEDVALGYVKITAEDNDNYFHSIVATLAYMPFEPLTALWDWQNGNPTSITNAVPEGTDQSGTIASSITGISLDYLAASSGAYVKLQYRSGNDDAHFYTGTRINVPVTSTNDIITIVSHANYNYTVGGDAATSLTTIHKATADEVTAGYVAIIATGESYLYSIKLEKRASVTIGSTEWATFSSDYATDFTNLSGVVDAYQISGASGSAITKSSVTTAAASTGLLLNAEAGTYAIPLTTTGTDLSSTNKLVAGTGAAVNYDSNSGYNYVLVSDAGVAKFQHIVSGANGSVTIAKGKAYLSLDAAPARELLDIEGFSTGIQNIKVGTEDHVYYDLSGRRVLYPTKGLYIVNGKKVIVK